jgi:DNA-binding MarR family transcriptional regulator
VTSARVVSANSLAEVQAANWIACFVEVDRAISRSLDRQMMALLGVSHSQSRVLVCLARQRHMTQVQLAYHLDCDLGALSRLIARLIAKGVVTKRRHTDDRRCWCVTLTEQGVAMLPLIFSILKRRDDSLTGPLTNNDRHSLAALLKHMLANSAVDKQKIEAAAEVA